MKRFVLFIAVLVCGTGIKAQGEHLGKFHRGEDSIVFVYQPLADKPVTLHYYIPTEGDVRRMPVLISFRGAERSAGITSPECRNMPSPKAENSTGAYSLIYEQP